MTYQQVDAEAPARAFRSPPPRLLGLYPGEGVW